MVIDFAWLGTGRVRFGFVINGKVYYCHYHQTSNAATNVYMKSPNLPIRYELTNDGNGGASSLKQICAAVQTEGGVEIEGSLRSVETGESPIAINANVRAALLGIRLKSTHLHAVVDILSASVIATTQGDKGLWQLVFNPTVGGTFTYNNLSNSCIQYAVGANTNTVTGGTVIDGGYFESGIPIRMDVRNLLRLGAYIDDTPTTLILSIRPVANLQAMASLTWVEAT